MWSQVLIGIGGIFAAIFGFALITPNAGPSVSTPEQVVAEIKNVAEVPLVTNTVPVSEKKEVITETPSVAVAPKKEASVELYDVVKVVDGDTVTLRINGVSESVRLIGINTPETVDPRTAVECFGKEASEKTKSLLTGKKVRLESEPSQGVRDKYNRLLGYIHREDGLFVNKHLIEEGYAYEYKYNLPYKYEVEFKAAQALAQSEKRGLWAPGACEDSQAAQTTSPTPTPIQQPIYTPPANASGYTCSMNTYNCPDFNWQVDAQAVFEACGGITNDIHRLDGDYDGVACESLN